MDTSDSGRISFLEKAKSKPDQPGTTANEANGDGLAGTDPGQSKA